MLLCYRFLEKLNFCTALLLLMKTEKIKTFNNNSKYTKKAEKIEDKALIRYV